MGIEVPTFPLGDVTSVWGRREPRVLMQLLHCGYKAMYKRGSYTMPAPNPQLVN